MSKRQGPIGWLLTAFRADPVGAIGWTVVAIAGALLFLGVALHLMIRGWRLF